MEENSMTAQEIGAFLAKKRKALGLTQPQVAELVGMTSYQYLSYIENGKVNVLRSEYFDDLVKALRLSEEEVRTLKPSAIITVAPDTPVTPQTSYRTVEIPAGLQELIDGLSHKWPELQDPDIQQGLAQIKRRGPGPETFDEWLDFYSAIRKHLRKRE